MLTHPFYPILHDFTLLKNNPNCVIFFYEDDNQLQIQVPPGSGVTIFMIAQLIASTGFQSKQNIADWTSKHVIYFSPFNNWLSTEEKGRRKIGRRRRCDGVSWGGGGGRQSNPPPPLRRFSWGGAAAIRYRPRCKCKNGVGKISCRGGSLSA